MRIVVDTNVLISGVFFGGFPRKILSAVVERKITSCASTEIVSGDKDLLDLQQFEDIRIVTAKQFYEKYLT